MGIPGACPQTGHHYPVAVNQEFFYQNLQRKQPHPSRLEVVGRRSAHALSLILHIANTSPNLPTGAALWPLSKTSAEQRSFGTMVNPHGSPGIRRLPDVATLYAKPIYHPSLKSRNTTTNIKAPNLGGPASI